MAFLLHRCWLAGLVIGAVSGAAPAWGQASIKTSHVHAGHVASPTPDAPANADHFVALCETKLQLAPAKAEALHTYLNQEIDYLRLLALAPPTPEPASLVAAETNQFGQVMEKLLSPTQLRQYRQVQQLPQAQAYLHSMALLPEAPAGLAKKHQHRTNEMLAQRLDAEE